MKTKQNRKLKQSFSVMETRLKNERGIHAYKRKGDNTHYAWAYTGAEKTGFYRNKNQAVQAAYTNTFGVKAAMHILNQYM